MERELIPSPFAQPWQSPRRAVLLTCYMTGATEGKNLATAGYSYDFVAKLFAQLLSRWGEVISVPNPKKNLEAAAKQAREQGFDPVHFSILPFQDVCLAKTVPNVVVPAWEFPDVPDHGFDDNPQNDWPATADRCDLVLASGPFTHQALRKAKTKVPIRLVQVPTPDSYFSVADWEPDQNRSLDCTAYVFPQLIDATSAAALPWRARWKQTGKQLERSFRQTSKALIGPARYARLTAPLKSLQHVREQTRTRQASSLDRLKLRYQSCASLELSGVVYTSIFNPSDGRKNWQDLLTGFLFALGDREDATLVLKLVSKRAEADEEVIDFYQQRDIPHRCKVVILCDFLDDEQLRQLTAASTYYLQTTRAEGNCLPLMNFLAAGRPGVSPNHSAMGDYFDESLGYVIESHPEPAAWPHDKQLRLRTTWGRLVWPSIVEQIQQSYDCAKNYPEQYAALAERCRDRMQGWVGTEAVWERLRGALDALVSGELNHPSSAAVSNEALQKAA